MTQPSPDKTGIRILIVEDQSCVAYLLEDIEKKFGTKINDFSQKGDVRVVNSFAEAKKLAHDPDFNFDIVILDNRLVTERHDDEKAETDYFPEHLKARGYDIKDEFSSSRPYAYGNGYELLPDFEAKGAVVIGNSSMSESEIQRLGIKKAPELRCSKNEIPEEVVERALVTIEKIRERNEAEEAEAEGTEGGREGGPKNS